MKKIIEFLVVLIICNVGFLLFYFALYIVFFLLNYFLIGTVNIDYGEIVKLLKLALLSGSAGALVRLWLSKIK